MKKAEAVCYRQGDVLLVPIATLPPNATLVSCDDAVVLAYGEATGHRHQISAKYANLYECDGGRLIKAKTGACLLHEEHAPIVLQPGFYKVVQQREYHPAALRPVCD
jgi:hypothetical protein